MSRSATSVRRKRRDTYHHGELRRALIAAAESILSERGIEGFTLREAARRAGVSPAAPAHHFGDAAGLLTEVATLGFAELGRMLEEADKSAGDPRARLIAQGHAYVRFAVENRARFQLMFRAAKLDPGHGDFLKIADRAFAILADAVRDLLGEQPDAPPTQHAMARTLALWSLVHGFAYLVLEGQADRVAALAGATNAIKTMLPLVLDQLDWTMPA